MSMEALRREARVALATLLAFLTLALQGCALSLPPLESSANVALAQVPLKTMTILPVDVTLDADDERGNLSPVAAYDASVRMIPLLQNAVQREVGKHAWPHAEMAWDGSMPGGPQGRFAALDPVGMANLADWLLGWTYALLGRQASAAGGGQIPPLPLASDVSLYIGGFGHLHKDITHRQKVARNVGIGIAVAVGILIVVLLFVVSKGRLGFGWLFPPVPPLDAIVFPLFVFSVVEYHRARTYAAIGPWLPPGHVDSANCNLYLGIHDGVDYNPQRLHPTLSPDQRKANVLALGATLVDNKSGRVLWTAAQPMNVDAIDPEEIEIAVAHLLHDLPAARP